MKICTIKRPQFCACEGASLRSKKTLLEADMGPEHPFITSAKGLGG